MPRRPSPTDRTFLNRVRRTTSAIVHSRRMVVENSTRRLAAYGVVGTARVPRARQRRADGGSALMLTELIGGLREDDARPALAGRPPEATWPG